MKDIIAVVEFVSVRSIVIISSSVLITFIYSLALKSLRILLLRII
jgi:hypothetical protein